MAKRQELDKAEQTAQKIEELRQAVLQGGISSVTRGKLLTSISLMKDSLDALSREIDPVRMPDSFFDPTEPRLIGHFVALALIAQERQALKDLTKFYGAGVYAIYYTGDADLYAPISRTETPIYVGKADPNANAKTLIEQGTKLADRLNEHRKSIGKASTTLDIADFECRALAVQSGYQAAAESHLIRLFKPIWNNETRFCLVSASMATARKLAQTTSLLGTRCTPAGNGLTRTLRQRPPTKSGRKSLDTSLRPRSSSGRKMSLLRLPPGSGAPINWGQTQRTKS